MEATSSVPLMEYLIAFVYVVGWYVTWAALVRINRKTLVNSDITAFGCVALVWPLWVPWFVPLWLMSKHIEAFYAPRK